MRDAVASRLGYSPFDQESRSEIRVTLQRERVDWVGIVALHAAPGAKPRVRTLRVAGPDCAELAASVALAISIAVDPASAVHLAQPVVPAAVPAPTVQPEPRPAPPPAVVSAAPIAPVTAAPAGQPPPAVPVSWAGGLGPVLSWGTAPATAIGLQLAVEARRRNLALAIEGRADLPASEAALEGATVRSYLMLLALAACAHSGGSERSSAYGCALFSGGALEGHADGVSAPQRRSTAFFAAGGRLGARLPLAGAWSVDLHGDVIVPLTPTTLRVGDREAWTTKGLAAAAGAALVVRLQ